MSRRFCSSWMPCLPCTEASPRRSLVHCCRTWLPPKRQTNLVGTKYCAIVPDCPPAYDARAIGRPK